MEVIMSSTNYHNTLSEARPCPAVTALRLDVIIAEMVIIKGDIPPLL